MTDCIGVFVELNPGTKIKAQNGHWLGFRKDGLLMLCDYLQYLGRGQFSVLHKNGKPRTDIVPDAEEYIPVLLDTHRAVESVRVFFEMARFTIEFREGCIYFKTALLHESVKSDKIKHCGNGNFIAINKYRTEVP